MTKIWGWVSIACFLTAAVVSMPFIITGQHADWVWFAVPAVAGAMLANRLDWMKRGVKA